ncbi:GSCOCG00012201001-RA-CDS, partial [Cotesia congregata]
IIGFSSDTCNTMTGVNHSVFSLLKKDILHIACIKCSCHMINLSANKACLKLPRSVEDLIRNLGSHFNRSAKRIDAFKEFQEFFGVKIHKILTLAQTRWLSVEGCVDRLLEQYVPLNHYLRQTVFDDPSKTTEDMLSTMENKFTIIYLEFMSYVLGLTTDFNVLFQSEKPLLHILKPEVEKLVKQISANYMKIDYIRSCKEILKADFTNLDNFIDIKNIYLGIQADKSLKEIKENSNIPDSSIVDFLRTCRAFYIELVTDIVVRFDFSDPIFDIIKIVNPKVAQKFEVKSLNDVFVRFPILCNNVDQQQADVEWRDHALLNYDELNLDASKPPDEYWTDVFNLKNKSNVCLFPNLKIVITALLSLPFSNASVERAFSNLKKIKTDNRNKLNTETVSAIMITKNGLLKNSGCIKFEPSKKND